MARFSICFQNSHGWLNPSLTLGQHLEELLARRYPRAERAGRAALLAGEVGLEVTDLGLLPRQASGGMVQKTLLALALALDRPLWCWTSPPARWTRYPAGRCWR